jgi:hypothetical protein
MVRVGRAVGWGLVAGVVAAMLPLPGCELTIPDVTKKGAGPVVREGRMRPIAPAAAAAGSVRVVGAEMDVGAPACGGDAAHRLCVRGGLTAGEQREQK